MENCKYRKVDSLVQVQQSIFAFEVKQFGGGKEEKKKRRRKEKKKEGFEVRRDVKKKDLEGGGMGQKERFRLMMDSVELLL